MPGARFSKAPETFRARKAIAKSRTTLGLQSCFILFTYSKDEGRFKNSFIQEVSGVNTSPFLDTDDLKMALRARKLSGAFSKALVYEGNLPSSLEYVNKTAL